MGECWRILGRQISAEEQERAMAGQTIDPFHPAPGLLLTRGDGVAVEVTAQEFAFAMHECREARSLDTQIEAAFEWLQQKGPRND